MEAKQLQEQQQDVVKSENTEVNSGGKDVDHIDLSSSTSSPRLSFKVMFSFTCDGSSLALCLLQAVMLLQQLATAPLHAGTPAARTTTWQVPPATTRWHKMQRARRACFSFDRPRAVGRQLNPSALICAVLNHNQGSSIQSALTKNQMNLLEQQGATVSRKKNIPCGETVGTNPD